MPGISPSAESLAVAAPNARRYARFWPYVTILLFAIGVLLAIFAALSGNGQRLLAVLTVGVVARIAGKALDQRGSSRLPAEAANSDIPDDSADPPRSLEQPARAMQTSDSTPPRNGIRHLHWPPGRSPTIERRSRHSSHYRR